MTLPLFVEALERRGIALDDDAAAGIYAWLRQCAQQQRRRSGGGETLCTTALVHEAWLRLFSGEGRRPFRSREHFLATAAIAMRCLLVDHLRRDACGTRVIAGLGAEHGEGVESRDGVEVLALHEALERLAATHARAAQAVELRFFGGLTEDEAADVLGITARTVRRDWVFAQAWLRTELEPEPDAASGSPR